MAQTAIDLLFEQFDVLNSDSSIPVSVVLTPEDWLKLYLKFKAMEKEQIMTAHYDGFRYHIGTTEISEQYYKDNYNK